MVDINKIEWHRNGVEDYISNVKSLNDPAVALNPVHIKIYFLSETIEKTVGKILDKVLLYLDMIYIKDTVYAILKESITNGVKANIKRIYFQEKNADISDTAAYERLIPSFKKDTLTNREHYQDLLREHKYFVIVSIMFSKDALNFYVTNNVGITPVELRRIRTRIDKAKGYKDLSEVFMEQADETEGAGLGISMSLLMLKNEGVETNSYTIESENSLTTVNIGIPLVLHKSNPSYQRTEKIIEGIDKLPVFSQTINQVQALLRKPETTISAIADLIQTDVSLSANLLKLANSGAFIQQSRVESIERAIQLVGLKELNNILLGLGTKKIMEDRYSAFEEVWESSNRCAAICRLLATRMNWRRNFIISLVCAALLHDVGRVVILSLEPDLMKKINDLAGEREFHASVLLEEISLGITHTTVGGMICEKWNFSENITKAVQFHHRPLMVEQDFREIVYPIYLADSILEMMQGRAVFSHIHENVLKYFHFLNKDSFMEFVGTVEKELLIPMA